MIFLKKFRLLCMVFALLLSSYAVAMESGGVGQDYPIVHVKSELARLAGGLYRLSGELNGLLAEFEGLKRYVDQLSEPPAYNPEVGVLNVSAKKEKGVRRCADKGAQLGSADEPIDKTAFKKGPGSGSSSYEEL